jgi:uncharacterized heparinase superfamily protein
VAGQRVFVDTGLSTYEDLKYRAYERSTAAHNTVVIDGQNSSDVWGLFKLGRRARIVDVSYAAQDDSTTLSASHNGYSRRGAALLHRREWSLRPDRLILLDALEGVGERHVAVYFHLHPSLSAELMNAHTARICLPGGQTFELTVDTRLALTLEDGYRACRFGERQAAKRLRAAAWLSTPVRLRHELTGWPPLLMGHV